ncbi:MAG: 3'(2'),5'-bisphosphate nucleotidase CysQ [Cyanobacteria bacterium P01_H01_bin.121]
MDTIGSLQTQVVLDLAKQTAWGAAKILRAYYRGETPEGEGLDLNVQEGKDGPVTAADLAVNQYILKQFQPALPASEFGYLTEESYKASDANKVFTEPWVWVIDPLDGTRDFIEKTDEYAIHLALTHAQRPVLSVVALPEFEQLYYAVKGSGTFVEDKAGNISPVKASDRNTLEELALVVSRTHRDDRFKQFLTQYPVQKQVHAGSVGFKIVTILQQKADVYISLSGKSAPKDWDMCAPELILTEAGGQFTQSDGSPLRYNTGDISQWGCLIASNGKCQASLCQAAETLLKQV